MTQKAPERIWRWVLPNSGWVEYSDVKVTAETSEEYLRIDHAIALVAAERDACADNAVDWVNGFLNNEEWTTCGVYSHIHVRADAAQAALEWVKREARNEALREASEAVHYECWTDGNQDQVTSELLAEQATTSLAIRAIEGLITEDKNDG
jgi:hypothetical protein